jgi:hypothetical protein
MEPATGPAWLFLRAYLVARVHTRSVALDGVTVSGHPSAGRGAVEILAIDDERVPQRQPLCIAPTPRMGPASS